MPKPKYQLADFMINVKNEYKDFVTTVHEMLVQQGYKTKIELTKKNGLQLFYREPEIKSTIGIILYFLFHDEKLMIRLYGKNYNKYLELLNDLPEIIIKQIEKSDQCKKLINPKKCWTGCMGYDFYIKDKRYQKCLVNCFLLEVDLKSLPFLLELIKSESKERLKSN
ncbi:MAG: hypothetical protein FWE36_07020 [Erysipelotrichales bacterium]|nr:hypothetical protein [Erysipelotrichales bacterium]